jgi:Uncharacterized MobA-related protein
VTVTETQLPLVTRTEVEHADTGRRAPGREHVVGVVLAAGTGSRYGASNKLLAELEGRPLVCRATKSLLDAALTEVVVVLGHEADRVRDGLAGCEVRFVENPDYAAGQSTSVGVGVEAARDVGADAVVFLPGDMPLVSSESVDHLIRAYRSGVASTLAVAHDGERGNPVLFDDQHFAALTAVDGDTGGRAVLLECDNAALLAVRDPGVRVDIDTPADLAQHR